MEKQNLVDLLSVIKELCTQYLTVKCIGSMVYGFFVFAFGVGNRMSILALICLLGLHWITGIARAWRDGEPIVPARWMKMVLRGTMYMVIISAARITEVGIFHFGESFFLDEIIIGFLSLQELGSILENAGKMGFAIPNLLLNRIKKYQEELEDKEIK